MKKQENLIANALYVLIILAVLFSFANIFMIQTRKEKFKEAQEIVQERVRPAQLEVIKITLADCNECYDIDEALTVLKNQNINIAKEESFLFNSEKAQELIKKYRIKKLPTLIIRGEINKSEQLSNYLKNVGDLIDNIVVYKAVKPPYYDLLSKAVVGRVSLTNLIDSSCKECGTLSQVALALKQFGVSITKEETIEYNSNGGQELIKKFNVQRIPAIIISKDIDVYESLKEELTQLKLEEKNGFYAIHTLIPPYRDLKENKIVGLVDIILLTDNSCTACYDVNINKQVLRRFGIVINSEKLYDVNSKEGIELISKYNIIKAPILIASPEANVYSNFVSAWNSVGTIEDDGWFVMRKPEVVGTIKDLETNTIIEAR